ncbi:MAG: hypothetical protein P1U74_09000 [Legionellaceae bacterium]|nr:hypothetical protein [Legionellaceae bacterium]
MTSNLSEMHYLEDLVSDEYKKDHASGEDSISFLHNNPVGSLSVLEQRDYSLTEKINLIKRIRDLSTDESRTDEAVKFFSPFVCQGWELARIFSTILGEQKKTWADKNLTEAEVERNIQRIADMMIYAAVLEVVAFSDKKIHNDSQRVLEQFLFDKTNFDSGLDFGKKLPKPSYFEKEFRADAQYYNILVRLLIVRSRRILAKLAIVINYCKNYVNGLAAFEKGGAAFFFSYLSWMFFLPRLIINIATTIRSMTNWGLSKLDIQFGWKKRLMIHLESVWAELANDIMWFASGICSCFVLAGCIPIIGVYFLLGAQIYDLAVNCFRSHWDMHRVKKIKERFEELGKINQLNEQMPDIEHFLRNLEKRIQFDRRMLFYLLSNFSILLVCIVFMMPAFATISPIIPLVAAAVTLLTAVYHFRNVVYFRAKRKELYGGTLIASDAIGYQTIDYPLTEDNVTDIKMGEFKKVLVRKKSVLNSEKGYLYLVQIVNEKVVFSPVEYDLRCYDKDEDTFLNDYDREVALNYRERPKTISESQLKNLKSKLGIDLSGEIEETGFFKQKSMLKLVESFTLP